MAMNETPPAFDIVLRGYERRQVDEHLAALVNERMSAERRVADLEQHLTRVRKEYEAGGDQSQPSYASLGARVQKILALAEEEARDVRSEAQALSEQTRSQAATDVDQIRKLGEDDAQRRKAAAELSCVQIMENAHNESERIRAEAESEASGKMSSAEKVIEEARAKAAQIATEVEAKLAKRREQAERDMAARQEVADARLAETGSKADQIRTEAQKMRDDAEARAKQLLEAARREAEDLVTDARSKADRMRMESERDLAALTHRRDSINAQLSNVREMLATLTGSAANLIESGGSSPAAGPSGNMPTQPGPAAAPTMPQQAPMQNIENGSSPS
ncbi:MAG TPA: cellulose-binding protein [Sporichthyaceae bacterium]|nr:cellulose-binding protein [Sporichthyaceae bacterium]